MSEQDFEDTFEPTAEEPEVEAEAPVEEETAEEPETPVAEETPKEEPKVEPEQPQTVPLAALIKQRDEFKGEISQLRDQLSRVAQSAPAPQRPDPLEDPDGAVAFDANIYHIRELNRSQRLAEREYGAEFVQEAFAAAEAAGMKEQFGQSQFGWEDMAEWHKANVEAEKAKEVATEIGDPVAYKEKVRKELLAEIQAEQVAKTLTSPSLVDETSIGGRKAPASAEFTPLDDLL